MGMFDSFYDETNTEHQSKAFGCVLAVYKLGDTVQLHPNDGYWTNPEPDTNQPPADYDAETNDGWLMIRNNKFVGVSPEPTPNLPLYDYYGQNHT